MIKNKHLKKLQEIKIKLLEIRLKDVKKNFIEIVEDEDIVDEILKTIEKLPKSKQGVYLQWLLNIYKSNPKEFIINNENILIDLVNYNNALEKNIPGIEKDFLKQVKTFDEFTIFMKSIKDISHNHKRDKINKKDITLLFKNEEWFVLIPHSKEAAIKYGKGTQWCTSARKNNAFDSYNKNGFLIYFVNRKTTNKNVVIYFNTDEMEIYSFFDAKDKNITSAITRKQIGKQFYNKSMENFYKFLEKSKDKKIIFGLNLKKANDLVNKNKEIPKEILTVMKNNGYTVAHHLAQYNPNWSTDDKEILMLKNKGKDSVAHELAWQGDWTTDDKEILMLKNFDGESVAHNLVVNNENWTTQDKEILMLKNRGKDSVAHYLAQNNLSWSTDDKEILMLKNFDGESVAHKLTRHNPNWSTDDKEILMLKDRYGETVESLLN